jgi:hypothetical protein
MELPASLIIWQSEQSEKIKKTELKAFTLSHPEHSSLIFSSLISHKAKVDCRMELCDELLVLMLLKSHEKLKPFLFISLNDLIKDRIVLPFHKVPINELSVISDLGLSSIDDDCGVVILLKRGPKSIVYS